MAEIKKTVGVDVILTPEEVAEMFCSMDSNDQIRFFNQAAAIPKRDGWIFDMQLAWITAESGGGEKLTSDARDLMRTISEYSEVVK